MKTSAACQKHQWMCSTVETVSASSIMSPSVCAEWESTRNHKAEITLNRELCGSNLLWVTEQDDSSPSVTVNHSPSALQGCCSLCVCVWEKRVWWICEEMLNHRIAPPHRRLCACTQHPSRLTTVCGLWRRLFSVCPVRGLVLFTLNNQPKLNRKHLFSAKQCLIQRFALYDFTVYVLTHWLSGLFIIIILLFIILGLKPVERELGRRTFFWRINGPVLSNVIHTYQSAFTLDKLS